MLGKEPAKDVRRSALEIVIDNHEDQSPPASHHNNASGPEPTTKPPEPVRHEQVRIEFAEECKPISEHDSVINSSEEGIGELHNKTSMKAMLIEGGSADQVHVVARRTLQVYDRDKEAVREAHAAAGPQRRAEGR
ncbi:MAG: hypothetical protein P4M11_12970 [Candidatus Pacebacteria bacterium]|nr:hypothetical protein [Candidatus Paceibacterota bacterium]